MAGAHLGEPNSETASIDSARPDRHNVGKSGTDQRSARVVDDTEVVAQCSRR